MARPALHISHFLGLLAVLTGCVEPGDDARQRLRAGGDATVFDTTERAYGRVAPNLDSSLRPDFAAGQELFDRTWTQERGLGPVWNATSCAACHPRDGRGRPFDEQGRPEEALLVRLDPSHPATEQYGVQLQPYALSGVQPEVRVELVWSEREVQLSGGRAVLQRSPVARWEAAAHGELPEDAWSIRVAPPVFGLGLLEAIPAEAIMSRADPEDLDGDGISGRVRWVDGALGRLGWKAGQPTVMLQSAAAFRADLGLVSHASPEPVCAPKQLVCQTREEDGELELTEVELAEMELYLRALAVPAARAYPEREHGLELFESTGCAACHVPHHTTGQADLEALSFQEIAPFTDLLLHDMGSELADGVELTEASSREWRTPPLWGLGLAERVNGHLSLLHDGRARTLTEAILWHAGEASASQEAFRTLSERDREDLLRFLRSL